MPDEMDRVQEAVQANIDAAVAAVTTRRPGCTHCVECGEPIGDYRRSLGATLCLPHQQAAEERARYPRGTAV